MSNPVLIFAQSYPHVKNVLYLLEKYKNTSPYIKLCVFNNSYLFKYFSLLNQEHFNNQINLSFIPKYVPVGGGSHKRNLIIFEKYFLYSSFNIHCGNIVGHEIFFFSQSFTDYGYYFLKKLYRKNNVTHIQDPGCDIYTITDGAPKSLRSFLNLFRMKLIVGRHIVYGDTGYAKFNRFLKICDSFYDKIVDRAIGKKERDELQKDVLLTKYSFKKYSKYKILYFDKDVVKDGFCDNDHFQSTIEEIFSVASEYTPSDQIGRKYKPNRTNDLNRNRVRIGEIIPDHIPAEMLYNDNVKVYIGITSIALANVETDNVISIVHLIPFHSSISMSGSIQNQERRRKNNIIQYPKTIAEFRSLLDDIFTAV
jgi:hypothetical protein